MAVAAYGSLISLVNVLNNLHYRAELRNLHVDIKLIESLQEGVNCLVDYVELHHQREGQGDLWRQLSKLAFDAQQMFDLHVVDQLRLRSLGEKADLGSLTFNEDVERLIQQIDIIKKELPVVEEDVRLGRQPRIVAPGGDSSTTSYDGKSAMVGFDEHLHQILDRLTSDQRDIQIIPIVGMGGIGKTTLARNAFNNALIVEHFDIRIWLTISQDYSVHEILLGLLNDGEVKKLERNFDRLGEDLHKKLFGRRYLIVMDDVWGIEAWDDLRLFFPNNCNKSRVMMTTRLTNLADSLGCHNPYTVSFLDQAKSWNLFCKTIFAQDDCPYPELERVGKSIATCCGGLPLEIIVIGSHLANSSVTVEYWLYVAENMSSFGSIGDYEHCMKVLYLSYNNLPIHLKLCFLYTGFYKEDAYIVVEKLIRRWIGEGFIKPDNGKDFERIGKEYIKQLITRNLISGNQTDFTLSEDTVHEFCIHDLFRDLCLREYEKEQFLNSPKIQCYSVATKDGCFHCGGDAGVVNLLESVSISRTTSKLSGAAICGNCEMMYSELKLPRFVKVANIVKYDGNFETEIKHFTQLGYASVGIPHDLILEFVYPCMLHLLWNLQILMFCSTSSSPIVLPPEIWEMPQLRDILCNRDSFVLSDPTDSGDMGEHFVILKNLQSLGEVCNFKCAKKILDRIPNLKRLGIRYEDGLEDDMKKLHDALCDLIHLQKLEFLSIKNAALENAIFPNSLKCLFLRRCKISWKEMNNIGSLPNLEVLYLKESGEGSEWTPMEGEFLQLRMLMILNRTLRCWNADAVHFPKLEKLFLCKCELLEEIPSGIGDIATLQSINIENCSEQVKESAKEIWREQQSMGNESLQIRIDDRQYLGEDDDGSDDGDDDNYNNSEEDDDDDDDDEDNYNDNSGEDEI